MERFAKQAQERIKYLIETKCGGSQQIFADRVGINKASVSQYVNGRNVPTNTTAKRIAEVFGVNPAWVMGFDVPERNSKTEIVAAKLIGLDDEQLTIVEAVIDNFKK